MSEQAQFRAIQQVEIWQAQNYWPIKGWSAPLSGTPHFSCHLLPGLGSDTFPEDLPPLQGWEWTDKWTLDSSSRSGQPDAEGWLYATTFDRLGEMMKNGVGVGVASKTSLVRKRRWIRSMICNVSDVNEAIAKRIDTILIMLRNIDGSLKDKETAVKSVKFYEENRSFVFSQSLHLATQGTLNTLTLVKDLGGKLKLIKQYLQDRAAIEREYSGRIEGLAKKYWTSHDLSPVTARTPQRQPFHTQQTSSNTENTPHSLNSPLALSMSPIPDELSGLTASDLFFGKIYTISHTNAASMNDFANNLINLVTTEIDQMLLEIHTVLKEARMAFRKNSDICRLSEAAIRNFLASVNIAYESVNQASLKDITELTEELNCLKGASAYSALTFATIFKKTAASPSQRLSASKRSDHITSMTQAMSAGYKGAQRDDLWLAVQRYKLAVRDSQEALCVLISDSMDLELQQQIFANRVHILYGNLIKSYSNDEVSLLHELQSMWTELRAEMIASMQIMRLPYPVLQSPFAQLQQTLDGEEGGRSPLEHSFLTVTPNKDNNRSQRNISFRDTPGAEGEGDAAEDTVDGTDNSTQQQSGEQQSRDRNSDEEVVVFSTPNNHIKTPSQPFLTPGKQQQAQQDHRASQAVGMGIFSFTFLYREPLPRAPGVAKSGTLLFSPASMFFKSKNVLFDAIWKTVYIIATSDGYVHLLNKKKSDMPDRSFYLKDTIINETPRDEKLVDSNALIFELSMAHNNATNKNKAMFQESIFLRCETAEEATTWVEDLLQLTLMQSFVDETVEMEGRTAMLASLPILKGETAKIDLELQRYQQFQSFMSTTSASSHHQPGTSDHNSHSKEVEEENVGIQEVVEVGEDDGSEGDSDDDLLPAEERQSFSLSQQQREQRTAEYYQEQEEEYDQDNDNDDQQQADGQAQGEEDGEASQSSSQQPRSSHHRISNHSNRGNYNNVARKSYVYGSNLHYTKEDGHASWKTNQQPTANRRLTSIALGVTPVNADLRPRHLIPVVDRSVPLAKRHSTLIAQYEQALQKEKELVESRVNESRGKRLQDYVDVLPEMPPTPGKSDSTATEAAEGGGSSEGVADLTATMAAAAAGGGAESAVSPDSTTSSLGPNATTVTSTASSDEASSTANRRASASRRLVKTLSQKFDLTAMSSGATK